MEARGQPSARFRANHEKPMQIMKPSPMHTSKTKGIMAKASGVRMASSQEGLGTRDSDCKAGAGSAPEKDLGAADLVLCG